MAGEYTMIITEDLPHGLVRDVVITDVRMPSQKHVLIWDKKFSFDGVQENILHFVTVLQATKSLTFAMASHPSFSQKLSEYTEKR